MRFLLWGATLSTAFVGSAFVATQPHAAGLDGLHAKVQIGNRLCMSGHTHHGSGASKPSRVLAAADAARAWGSFTALEYGREWADFNQAHAQDMQCKSGGGRDGALWSCNVTATPCKPLHAGTVAAPAPAHRTLRGRPQHVAQTHGALEQHPAPQAGRSWPGDTR